MAITGKYRGVEMQVPDFDLEHLGYFEAAAEHKLVMKKCASCGLLRYPPSPGCPWCASLEWEWQEVEGTGTIYSYEIVTKAIQPAFEDWVPYPVVLVELDVQKGQPNPEDGLRMVSNLVDDSFNPEKEENIAIGKRVEVVFLDAEGVTIPLFKLSATQPPDEELWQYQAR